MAEQTRNDGLIFYVNGKKVLIAYAYPKRIEEEFLVMCLLVVNTCLLVNILSSSILIVMHRTFKDKDNPNKGIESNMNIDCD